MFFPLCLAIGARSLGGSVLFYVIWAYASICVAVFLVRTMKRIILHEVRQYSEPPQDTSFPRGFPLPHPDRLIPHLFDGGVSAASDVPLLYMFSAPLLVLLPAKLSPLTSCPLPLQT